MKKLKDFAPILVMLCCVAIVGSLLLTGVIDLDTIPRYVEKQPLLALSVIAALYVLKGLSGVILYNALVLAVSLIFPMWAALLVNAIGTALTLSVSYFIGARTKTDSIDSMLEKHPKLKKFFSSTREYGFVACFSIHMAGLSMEVLGVLFGMLRIDFWTYLSSSWLAILPGMLCFTIAGNNLNFHSPVFWIVLAVDLLLMVLAFFYTKNKLISHQEHPRIDQ